MSVESRIRPRVSRTVSVFAPIVYATLFDWCEIGERDGGFYVKDDGPGIAEDEREQVFEAGYSSSHHGTGFGLSIVQEIVEAHDWDIRVTDSSDGGARFEITGVEYVDQ